MRLVVSVSRYIRLSGSGLCKEQCKKLTTKWSVKASNYFTIQTVVSVSRSIRLSRSDLCKASGEKIANTDMQQIAL
jgi:hypothetical protein